MAALIGRQDYFYQRILQRVEILSKRRLFKLKGRQKQKHQQCATCAKPTVVWVLRQGRSTPAPLRSSEFSGNSRSPALFYKLQLRQQQFIQSGWWMEHGLADAAAWSGRLQVQSRRHSTRGNTNCTQAFKYPCWAVYKGVLNCIRIQDTDIASSPWSFQQMSAGTCAQF